ncbi:MAG: hypothetical protein Q7T71_20850 [Herbiconiux sp.]|nr:hypothetical protein [Herbiconiux sp.]
MTLRGRGTPAVAILALITGALLAGCTAVPVDSAAPIATATPPGAEFSTEPPQPQGTAVPTPAASSATEGFLAWLSASRAPDAAAACSALSPDLVTRMIDELNATSPAPVHSCEEMITATAALYRAVGDDPTVDISVQDETATSATLFVTYLASGDCGTVVMERTGADWTITEQSTECAAG